MNVHIHIHIHIPTYFKGGSRTAATFKMERWEPLTIITKRSIADVAAVLDPPLYSYYIRNLRQVTSIRRAIWGQLKL